MSPFQFSHVEYINATVHSSDNGRNESPEGVSNRVGQRPVHDQLISEAGHPQLPFPGCPIRRITLHRQPRVSAELVG